MSDSAKQDSGLSRFLRAVRWAIYLGVAAFVIVTVALWLGESENREHISSLLPDGDNKGIMLFALMCAVSLACAGVALALLRLAEKLPAFVWHKAAAIPYNGRWAIVVLVASIAGHALVYNFDALIDGWSGHATGWLNKICKPSQLQCGDWLDGVILFIRRIPIVGILFCAAWFAVAVFYKKIRKSYIFRVKMPLRQWSKRVMPDAIKMADMGFLVMFKRNPPLAILYYGKRLLSGAEKRKQKNAERKAARQKIAAREKTDVGEKEQSPQTTKHPGRFSVALSALRGRFSRKKGKKEDTSGETLAESAGSHLPAPTKQSADSQSQKIGVRAKVGAKLKAVRDKWPFKKKKKKKSELKLKDGD